jgi:hypothetical protein
VKPETDTSLQKVEFNQNRRRKFPDGVWLATVGEIFLIRHKKGGSWLACDSGVTD